jgi:hypothetical protein
MWYSNFFFFFEIFHFFMCYKPLCVTTKSCMCYNRLPKKNYLRLNTFPQVFFSGTLIFTRTWNSNRFGSFRFYSILFEKFNRTKSKFLSFFCNFFKFWRFEPATYLTRPSYPTNFKQKSLLTIVRFCRTES